MIKKIFAAALCAGLVSTASAAYVSYDNWEVDEAVIKRVDGKLNYVAHMDYGDTMYEVRVAAGKASLFVMRKNTGKYEASDDADTLQLFLDARGELEKQFK